MDVENKLLTVHPSPRLLQRRSFLAVVVLLFTLLNVYSNTDPSSLPTPSWLVSRRGDASLSYREYPESWTVEGLRDAAMTPEESVHYRLETDAGAAEWASTLPRGKGVVHLPDGSGPFRLAMFHQLECLSAVRAAMMARRAAPWGPATSVKAHFCLNYLRQTLQCHADAHLEMVRSEYGGRAVLPYTTRTDCKDWEHVWHAAEENHDAWVGETGI